MKREMLSPAYTTNFDELAVVKVKNKLSFPRLLPAQKFRHKKTNRDWFLYKKLVGMIGFEPTTPTP
ncbi:DUF4113 domain-containing protein [Providencia rettgeri]|uniref:DUF4113 domain-containing protein n=1 Tax=Providencia rettgeri TaxID=587 RepID=A0A939SR60_PRORE|nr:DUF4113 domain-containing protein [Providencia rettgeri]